jgi:hypothetical protein
MEPRASASITFPSATTLVAMSRSSGSPRAGTEMASGFVCMAGAAPARATIGNGGSDPPRATIVTAPRARPRSAQAPARPA